MPGDRKIATQSDLTLAHYSLTLREHKLVAVFLSYIDGSGQLLNHYDIPRSEVYTALGIKGRKDARTLVIKFMKRVQGKIITLPNNGEPITLSWFYYAKFMKGGFIRVKFSRDLHSYLTGFKRGMKGGYAKYRARDLRGLRSTYSVRMYQVAQQFAWRKSFRFSLDDLRGILGIAPGHYTDFKDLKRRVLQVARAEMYAKTSLGFNFKAFAEGEGQKTTHVEFYFYDSLREGKAQLQATVKSLVREPIPEKYVITKDSLNDLAYDRAYKVFKEAPRAVSDTRTFKELMFVQGFNVVLMPGGGHSLVGRQDYPKHLG